MRFPANELGIVSATLPAHFLQDGLRSRLDEHARHVFPQLRSLVRRGRGALLHVLRPVHGTYARLEHKLAAFYTRPRTQWHLAPALQRRQQRPLRNSACRRRLPVPTRAPCRRFASVQPTRQSRTSPRRQTAGNISREGVSVGTSFTLCTARSMVSPSSASSSSLIKIPLPPICIRGACCILSPAVLMTTISASIPVAAKSCFRMNSACHFASRLPRVPIRRVLTASHAPKEIGPATLPRFESFAGVLSRPATAPPAPKAASPAGHPSLFPCEPGPLPSDAGPIPRVTG